MADCCTLPEKPAAAPAVLSCPVSGTRSKQVDAMTVKALVRHLAFAEPSTQYYFCEAPDCDVVYFPYRAGATRFHRGDLLVPVWPKERSDDTPICYCFGVTRRAIRDEIGQTGKSTFSERIRAEVKAGRCACELKNPSGKCCLGAVGQAVEEARAASGQTPTVEAKTSRKVLGLTDKTRSETEETMR